MMLTPLLSALLCAVPGGDERTTLEVLPADVRLEGSRDAQRVVVLERRPDGGTVDRTADVTWRAQADAPFRIVDGTLLPVADGAQPLALELDGRTVELRVTVTGAGESAPRTFRLQLSPTARHRERLLAVAVRPEVVGGLRPGELPVCVRVVRMLPDDHP